MRGPATAPPAPAGPGRPLRTVVPLASAALLLSLLGAAPAHPAPDPSAHRLQQAFAAAANDYHVPQSVLLAVSYLQSRWDRHGGAPSVTGGYGPMHLTDARTALATAEHFAHGTEDARGDTARPAPHPAAGTPASSAVPARLRTLPKAAELTGIPAARLRSDPAANVAGGAALLAAAQRELGGPARADPADWYGA
ncbi:N-acetylmuramoyl-L-alanine amidase, partial [Streptomyces sp. NPDC002343]